MADERKVRPIMLICSECKFHDLDGDSLLEIDFNKCLMTYICRSCNTANVIKLNNNPSGGSYPKIGVRK
jgi:hypothetical protein